jgi:hypothetical protein
MLNNKKNKKFNYWACICRIATFHLNIISEKGFVVGSNGQSKRKDLKNRGKRHIGQGTREIHGVC